jgi:hypothetical protein
MPGIEGLVPETFDQFLGEYTLPKDVQAVKKPYSTYATNVQFYPGGVMSRPGLTSVATFTGLSVMSLKDYTLLDVSQKRVLALTSDGQLWKETGALSFSSVTTLLAQASVASSMVMNSTTMFGREYMAFGYGTAGVGGTVAATEPLAYDDTNIDRVAPPPPALAPTVGSGTGSNISSGPHNARIMFRTRNGFLTAPGPAGTFTFTGGTGATVSNITTGPVWVCGRVVAFTPTCNTNQYYFVAGTAMDIRDNLTTSVTFDVTDSTLISGTQVSGIGTTFDLLNQAELPRQAFSFSYKQRIGWLGETNMLLQDGDTGFLGTSFNGGWVSTLPNGWTSRINTGGAKGSITAAVGDCLQITGDGMNTRCQLKNNGGALAALALTSGHDIRARVRMIKSASAGTAPTFNIYIVTSSTGNASSGMQVTASQLSSSEWRWIDGVVLAAANNTPDITYELRISDGGTQSGGTAIPNGEWLAIDRIEFYSANAPFSPHLVRWSDAGQPDAYDQLTGIQNVSERIGEKLTSAFVLGNTCFFVKERSMYATTDDGFNEPAAWSVSNISNVYGSPSPKGVGIGDGWVVVASRAGLAYFNGARPYSISEDYRNTWQRINWQYGYLISVGVDTERRRITISVPLDGAVTASTTIVVDYYGDNPAQSRNFNRWFLTDGKALQCYTGSERSDGTRLQLYGSNHTNGIVYKVDDSAHADSAASGTQAINSAYQTYFVGGPSGRNTYQAATANVAGSGTFLVTGYLPDNTTTVTSGNRGLANVTLQSPTPYDVEWPSIDITAERCAFQCQTNSAGDWFNLRYLAVYYKRKPWTGIRGLRT